ncbi:hypothetical protein EGR_07601 [Echinococcus granulosus]|uniref:Uncharacterized protein n=1 Tax=Echinococcus granulosus TaxID=6210 RepID=W6U936_ECHGR|nr:hypothetical protein EGR_07601 [Echinococcus granulosus]EUB57510.1 hypothetical protein EGR_07601 [Echinococcus granulosus]
MLAGSPNFRAKGRQTYMEVFSSSNEASLKLIYLLTKISGYNSQSLVVENVLQIECVIICTPPPLSSALSVELQKQKK